MTNNKRNALAAIIICVLLWGFSFISIKITVAVFPPMSLGMLRFAIALFFLYFIKLKLAPAEKLRAKDIPLLIAAGLSGVTLYFFFENNGVAMVSVSEASIAVGSIPVLTMIADWLAGKITSLRRNRMAHNSSSAIRASQWLGCLISIAGVWLVAGVSFALSGSILGYIYMTGAAMSWVIYSFLTRSLFARCSRIYIVFWQTVAGFIFFIPFSVAEFQSWGNANTEVIIHLLFLGIFCSAFGYWFYVQALETLGVSVCAIFINLIPVVTVVAGFFMMGDRLTLLQWLGAALVIAGVYLAMFENRKKPAS
ncbi:MAG: DMT family transporter [Treponema sp.]|jgi:drug/metabolite transporter (DMT)-like permease|nr:DMT family transporter [Treponema sp.]